ncbi:hypothetical protein OUZ56_006533 [Daphnia magna]|uniref:MPN domain-containing protein n=1 Tax=Daphnia magna TaxID=35525 RepID=A0ABQ9YVZ9_9CRUS|nr:hypothetical protein OUZ56_006533 [Daphnia magna]
MDVRSQDPSTRLRTLTNFASSIKLESRVPIQRYFRSGTEMLRMADVYYKEGSIENAYTLYLKFLTIFVEKIIEHPEYHTLSSAERSQFSPKIKEVFPKTETLKQKLLHIFQQEHELYEDEMAKKKQEEILRLEKEMEALRIKKEDEERRRQYQVEKDKSMVDVGHRPSNEKSVLVKPDGLAPIFSANNLYPSNCVPSVTHETKAAAKELPGFDRNLKPRTIFLGPSGLRTVVLPASVLDEFVSLANSNTKNNVETCGILAGKLEQNQFLITHLLIPKQNGTSDSCTTQNEEELFNVQDKHNLVTLGWIHTHPTQTAFLSSVDLHTHCSYQLMMPEAVAVVCAPKYNETGYFTLTTNHGLDLIASCRQQGFHPHASNPPLFEVASHIQIHPTAPVSVIDLRKI